MKRVSLFLLFALLYIAVHDAIASNLLNMSTIFLSDTWVAISEMMSQTCPTSS